MKIGNIVLPEGAILAPMAGFTEVGFRGVCANAGASMTVTEMVSAKGLIYDSKNTFELLHRSEYEKICAIQLFGSEPDVMAEAVKDEALQSFDIIDINMGCPVPKVVKNGEGSALMKNISLASKVIEACKKNTNKPVTVKFRLGWDEGNINYIEFGKMCEGSGADAIALHSRTRAMMYSGKADVTAWEKLKKAVNIPVIASGDVVDIEGYNVAMQLCDGVMIGRGALGRPEIFAQIIGKSYESKLSIIKEHIEILKKYFDDKYIATNIRKHIAHYLKGIKGARAIKGGLAALTTTQAVIDAVSEVLE